MSKIESKAIENEIRNYDNRIDLFLKVFQHSLSDLKIL